MLINRCYSKVLTIKFILKKFDIEYKIILHLKFTPKHLYKERVVVKLTMHFIILIYMYDILLHTYKAKISDYLYTCEKGSVYNYLPISSGHVLEYLNLPTTIENYACIWKCVFNSAIIRKLLLNWTISLDFFVDFFSV